MVWTARLGAEGLALLEDDDETLDGLVDAALGDEHKRGGECRLKELGAEAGVEACVVSAGTSGVGQRAQSVVCVAEVLVTFLLPPAKSGRLTRTLSHGPFPKDWAHHPQQRPQRNYRTIPICWHTRPGMHHTYPRGPPA